MVTLRRARSGAADSSDSAATAVQMLAVLLQAGARPITAWEHLASTGESAARRVLDRTDEGASLTEAIGAEGGLWQELAAAWEVATTVGAPLAPILRSLAESLQDAATAADDVRIALAEPVGTARLLLWLPLAGLLLGFALGFDTVAVFVMNPIGTACALLGGALLFGAHRWTRALVRRARPARGTPGLHAELTAIALAGGAAIPRALRLVGDVAPGEPDAQTATVLELSRAAGVPAVELLRASAAQQRRQARTAGRLRAAELSARLLVPLGVCTLPAFLLLGVAPLILSVLAGSSLGLIL